MNPVSNLATTAQAFAASGRPVFPVQPSGKIPLTPHGFKDASTDPAIIAEWWDREPCANIGLVTGNAAGFWVLDIDGTAGESSLRALEQQHTPLPETVEVITGGGGRHIYFLYPPERHIACSAGKLGDGIDIRGDGGYIIAPPSVHSSGRPYTKSVDSAQVMSAAPAWLLDLIQNPATGTPPTPLNEWHTLLREGVHEGQRNDAMTRIAGKLLRSDLHPHLALEICHAVNEARFLPPLPEKEIHNIVNSIAARELNRRGA